MCVCERERERERERGETKTDRETEMERPERDRESLALSHVESSGVAGCQDRVKQGKQKHRDVGTELNTG